MKKCSYCAELIQDEAIVCRYCGRELSKVTSPNEPDIDLMQKTEKTHKQGELFMKLSAELEKSHSATPVLPEKQFATVPHVIDEKVNSINKEILLQVFFPLLSTIREWVTIAEYNKLQDLSIYNTLFFVNICVGIGVEFGANNLSNTEYIKIKDIICENFFNITTDLFSKVNNKRKGETNPENQGIMLPALKSACDKLSNLGRDNFSEVVIKELEDGKSSFCIELLSYKKEIHNSNEAVVFPESSTRIPSFLEKSNNIDIILEKLIQQKEIIHSMIKRKLSNPSPQDFFITHSEKINLLITSMGKSYSNIPDTLLDKIGSSSKRLVPVIGNLTNKMQLAGFGDENFIKQTEKVIVEKFMTVAFFCFVIGVETGKGFVEITDTPKFIEYIREIFADELIQMIGLLLFTGKLDNTEAYNAAHEVYYSINKECIKMVAFGNNLSNEVILNVGINGRTAFLNTFLRILS